MRAAGELGVEVMVEFWARPNGGDTLEALIGRLSASDDHEILAVDHDRGCVLIGKVG